MFASMYHGERFNSLTHLAGTALAIAGAAVLISKPVQQGDIWKIIAFSAFGAGLVLLYAASTLYHSFRGRAKIVLRKIDHAAIYISDRCQLRALHAGQFARPVRLDAVCSDLGGWRCLECTELGSATMGAILAIPYLIMGWIGVTAIVPLIDKLGWKGISWLATGGALYTAGIVFYLNDRGGDTRTASGICL